MCGERGSPGRCGWDEGREEGEKALEHALPSFRLLSLERVLVRHRGNDTKRSFKQILTCDLVSISFPACEGNPLTRWAMNG